jgi:hypothetical protein
MDDGLVKGVCSVQHFCVLDIMINVGVVKVHYSWHFLA